MAQKLGARRNAKWLIVSIAPDVCKTPPLGIPVPYQVISDLGNAQGTVDNVHLNDDSAFVFNQSTAPTTRGDEAGSQGGVQSGTVGAQCWPKEHSNTVRIGGQFVVREGDRFYMNGTFSGG